jgi:DegV family protein with EDD domain
VIRKAIRSVVDTIKDSSINFRERVFILLTIVMELVLVFAIVGDILCGENMVEIVALIITVFVAPVTTYIAVKKNRVYIAVRIIVVGLVGVLMPLLFYFGGGVHGGAILWMIFVYLYTGLVLSGMWKPFMLIVLTVESIGFYLDDYFHPERIQQHTNDVFYIDSLLSLIMIGIVGCIIVWFVEWLLREENKKVLDEVKKSEELNKSQSRFFSSMSHEIRTPINSILGLNEIILRQEDASEEIRKDAINIQGAGKMLLALVNDILDVSKIEAGKMDIVPVNYSVAALLSDIVNMIWLRAEQKGLEFKVEIDPTIPKELFGDEVRIKQILVNLLNNAVKYTREGSVTLHIEKEDTKDDNVRLLLSVTDTGMGIKQDSLPYLFDAFQRVDEEKNRRIEGTGLGLSIVKQLVDLMGGEIAVNSVYTQGSTFTVSLWQKVSNPIAVGDINITSSGRLDENKKYEAGFTAPDARVLIVDDNEMNLEVEKKLLDGTKINVDTADSGETALSMTTQFRYDIILMDHLMPEMDGIECMQRIRKQAGGLNNHAPVIALTANAGSENRHLYVSSGFDGCLVKPVSGLQLEEILLAHLPQSMVTLSEAASADAARLSTSRAYSKKIPVIITTSSMCDLPARILKELQIDVIPFKVHVDGREYYDGIEADTDEILRYMREGKNFESSPPTIEEFEFFFSQELRKAHQLIHITLAPGISKEYERAKEAAKAYGNVFVFNSSYNSSSIGMLALLAHSMSTQGMTPGNIISELTKLKKFMHCSFVANDPAILLRRGYVSKGFSNFMTSIGLKPVIGVSNDTFKVDALHLGDTRRCYEKYVDYAIPRWSRPDPELVFVTYSDVSPEDLAYIEKRIRNRAHFDRIIFHKAAAALALSCGSGAFGIMYMEQGEAPYNFEKMIEGYDEEQEDTYETSGYDERHSGYSGHAGHSGRSDGTGNRKGDGSGNADRAGSHAGYGSENMSGYGSADIKGSGSGASESGKDSEFAGKWYADIDGIDPEVAINNSGSEDAFESVLKIFYDSLDMKTEEIGGFYDTENWTDYTIKVHALKSSARLVGAVGMAKDSEALEMAGKAGDIDVIRKNHDALMEQLAGFKGRLTDAFEKRDAKAGDDSGENSGAGDGVGQGAGDGYGENSGAAGSGSGGGSIPDSAAERIEASEAMNQNFDDILLQGMYGAIKSGVSSKNEKMLKGTFKEMADYSFPEEHQKIFGQLKQLFEAGDYDGMQKILDDR